MSVKRDDSGSILPIVLVATVVLGMVVVAMATYVTTGLRYGQVVEARTDRISAAQGALDDTLEQLRIGTATPCASFDSLEFDFSGTINDLTPKMKCGTSASLLPGLAGWALAITGERFDASGCASNHAGDCALGFDGSNRSAVDGPIYLVAPARGAAKFPVVLGPDKDAPPTEDMYFTCPPTGGDPAVTPSANSVPDVLVDENLCINQTWQQIFGTMGPTPSINPTSNPTSATFGACKVFWPGTYTTAPTLAASNYFLSGSYFFDNVGDFGIDKFATFGRISDAGYPSIKGSACFPTDLTTGCVGHVKPDSATWSEAYDAFCSDNLTGAVIYARGTTRFTDLKDPGLEISGAGVGGVRVALQSIPGAACNPVTNINQCGVPANTPLIQKDTGGGNDFVLAIHGLLWAPYDRVQLNTLPSPQDGIMSGGAVIGSFYMKPSGTGMVVSASKVTAPVQLMVQATATDDRGSSTVRAVIDYVAHPPEVAVISRRVLETPTG